MPRFLVPTDSIDGDLIRVHGADARHVHRVLRLSVGDLLDCSLPDGHWAEARIVCVTPTQVEARITRRWRSTADPEAQVTVLQALTKGDVMDRIVQGLSEVGALGLVPVIAERSVGVPPPERREQRVERWRRIAEESCKQCGRTTPMQVTFIGALADVLQGLSDRAGARLVASPRAEAYAAREVIPASGPLVLAIGPEGGFSDDELNAYERHGFQPLHLGPRVLRCETAAVVACALAMAALGELARPASGER